MAKLIVIAAALLMALLALAEATTYTTNEKSNKQPGCQEQIQGPRDQEFQRACWIYLSQGKSLQPTQKEKQRITCCWYLERFTSECRCKAIDDMVKRQTKQGERQGQRMQQVLQTAQNLPKECSTQQPQQCQITP